MFKQQYSKVKKYTEGVKKVLASFLKGNKGQTIMTETAVVGIIVLVVLVAVFWPQVKSISTDLFSRMTSYISTKITQITT